MTIYDDSEALKECEALKQQALVKFIQVHWAFIPKATEHSYKLYIIFGFGDKHVSRVNAKRWQQTFILV